MNPLTFWNDHIAKYKDYLDLLDPERLQDKIEAFRRFDFRKLEYRKISEELMNLFLVTGRDSKEYLSSFRITQDYPVGTQFFRVRSLVRTDELPPVSTMGSHQDFWCPPAPKITIQRLNKANEAVLYTCPKHPLLAFKEARIEPGTFFVLIRYRSKAPVVVARIGANPDVNGLNRDQRVKHRIINAFYHDEFTREVGKGTEHLYKISNAIAKDHFDLPPQEVAGWCYSSVFEKESVNVAFRESVAKEKLEIDGYLLCRCELKQDGSMDLNVFLVGVPTKKSIECHGIGSPVQKRVFPEIATSTKL